MTIIFILFSDLPTHYFKKKIRKSGNQITVAYTIITCVRDLYDDFRGGVALFIKESLDFKIRDDLSVFIPHVFKSLFVELVSESGQPVIVGVIYIYLGLLFMD